MRCVLSIVILMLLLVSSTITITQSLFEYSSVKTVTVYAPAISSSGRGVLSKTTLAVAYPGSGRVFFSALPYTEVETQGAARIAAYVAALIANVDFSKYDYFILVESNTPLIGGPSAGGLITVGLTALLLNTSIYSNVTMTGMINPDGSIGFVGGLKEKLEAAKNGGFTVFLIPAGQRVYRYPVYEEIRRGPFVFRTIRYESIDLVEYGKQLGVSVVEVVDIGEAFYYFTGMNLSRSKITDGLDENLSRN
jgi:Archaeal serine proteases